MVLFISIEKVFLTFESEDEYPPLVLLIFLKKMALTFDSAEVLWDDYLMKEFNDSKDQILWCYRLPNGSCWTELSCSALFYKVVRNLTLNNAWFGEDY